MCCHSRGKGKHKWLLQPFVTVSVHSLLKRVSPPRAAKLVVQLAFISAFWRFLTRHARSGVYFPGLVSDKWKKRLLVSMRINPKACGDILDYKLTAYKCQAGSHGCHGATSSRCAVNIQHDVIEWLSGDNELNLFAQLLYIDGLLPQVIKVTFQLEHPTPITPFFSTLLECAIGVTFPAVSPNK